VLLHDRRGEILLHFQRVEDSFRQQLDGEVWVEMAKGSLRMVSGELILNFELLAMLNMFTVLRRKRF
jgi:hypothetical protein